MLELINRDFSGVHTVDMILEAWRERELPLVDAPPSRLASPSPVSLSTQLRFLLGRHALLMLRDPTDAFIRIPLVTAGLLSVSIIYVNARRCNLLRASLILHAGC